MIEPTAAMIQAAADEDFKNWDQQMPKDHYAALYKAMEAAKPKLNVVTENTVCFPRWGHIPPDCWDAAYKAFKTHSEHHGFYESCGHWYNAFIETWERLRGAAHPPKPEPAAGKPPAEWMAATRTILEAWTLYKKYYEHCGAGSR